MSFSITNVKHLAGMKRALLDPDSQYPLVENTANNVDLAGPCELIIEAELPRRGGPTSDGIYIYSGTIAPLVESEKGEWIVVVKVATTQDSFARIVAEGRLYAQELSTAAAETLIPTSLGAYTVISTGTASEGLRACGFLILLERGDHVQTEFKSMSNEDRFNLLETVMELHRLTGVHHGALEPEHVTKCKEVHCIIGFDPKIATTNNPCACREGLKADALWHLDVAPDPRRFGCSEIYRLCNDMDIWVPGSFVFQGMPVYLSEIEKDFSNVLEVVAKLADDFGYDTALRMAYEATNKYLMEWLPDSDLARRVQHAMENGFDERCREYKTRREQVPE